MDLLEKVILESLVDKTAFGDKRFIPRCITQLVDKTKVSFFYILRWSDWTITYGYEDKEGKNYLWSSRNRRWEPLHEEKQGTQGSSILSMPSSG